MITKAEDPAYPERLPDLFRRTSCAACKICWHDVRMAKCFYGGPYAGFTPAAESAR